MKKYQTVESRKPIFGGASYTSPQSCFFYHFKLGTRVTRPSDARAFTLIEVLVVIAIMGTLAALLLPVAGAVKRHEYIYNAQSEMAKIETAIDRYKAAYGFYPPGPTIFALTNQLFFELVGTTNSPLANGIAFYLTLDGRGQMSADDVKNMFGVGGFMNCSKPNGGEEATVARDFLTDLKPSQLSFLTNNNYTNIFIVTADRGPDNTYQPMGMIGVNPWRYVCPGTNNPGSYDLWVQLSISGKTNLICNWNQSVQMNSPLP
jgi:prepilin-type N-terminal cleavage/methylation domain-containing protein